MAVAESSAELAAAGAWWSRAGRFSRIPPLGSRGLVALRQATVGVTERRRLCVPKDEPVAQLCLLVIIPPTSPWRGGHGIETMVAGAAAL